MYLMLSKILEQDAGDGKRSKERDESTWNLRILYETRILRLPLEQGFELSEKAVTAYDPDSDPITNEMETGTHHFIKKNFISSFVIQSSNSPSCSEGEGEKNKTIWLRVRDGLCYVADQPTRASFSLGQQNKKPT